MDEHLRRVRRDFIRAHHPDHGGDTAEFIAGLAAIEDTAGTPGPIAEPDASSHRAEPPARVYVTADPPWPVSLFSLLLRRRRRRAPSRVD